MKKLLSLSAAFLVICCMACTGTPEGSAGAQSGKWHLGEPVIDSHVHIYPTMTGLATALEVFEQAGIGPFVVKSAGEVGSVRYHATLAMQKIMGDRMRSFANLDFQGIDSPDFGRSVVPQLERMKKDGIVGIKVFKNLGLNVRFADGTLVKIDDQRLAPIFEACGRLGLIFAWHVADPVAFFQPVTPENERFEELQIAQGWSFYGKDYPTHAELMAAQERVIARHPGTTFLLIHMGNNAEDLDYVGRLLDSYPNVYTDVSARVPEFGRHPAEKVREFFIRHQDRILFGSDFITAADGSMQLGSVSEKEPDLVDARVFFERHWRYFETADRQIDHPTPIQGRWKVDAINLPSEVLKKFYVTNARKLIFER
ncbi:MAG TPA: amidohydrolase family protein [Myxococcota bacterium]|nr:amidohydrolase family protein [Myxococcota bacterium]HOA14120.1 amidohydrolase family protein [Myxococcota bacterium]HOH77291.1 amidohydrolase family protein [Myxococcota bacterium]HPV04858.1 amidohydrolase family protein [Myxococcota bacterium]